MRAAPVIFTENGDLQYAQIDYARVIKAQGGIVVVNDADEDDETARQKIEVPAGNVLLGFGPNASATRAAADLLADLGIRVLSTVGEPLSFEPFDGHELAEAQALAFAGQMPGATAALYAARFADSELIAGAPAARLSALDAALTEETYAKYVARFKPSRFKRQPGGTDSTNVALTATEDALLRTATDVCRLLGLSTALGLIRTGSRLAFAQDLADSFRLDVGIPVGFLIGAQKLKGAHLVRSVVADNLHFHRVVPRMVDLVTAAFHA